MYFKGAGKIHDARYLFYLYIYIIQRRNDKWGAYFQYFGRDFKIDVRGFEFERFINFLFL